jgi:hypothetical protein
VATEAVEIDPPPLVTVNVTVSPDTANPDSSVTFTDGETATALLVSAVCWSPATIEILLAGPVVTETIVDPDFPSDVAVTVACPGDFA